VRNLRAVSQSEFSAFVTSYSPALTSQAMQDGLVAYTDTSKGDAWPDSLVASYLAPQPPKRPRATGWRIPVIEVPDE
jgi:hypothetical protein